MKTILVILCLVTASTGLAVLAPTAAAGGCNDKDRPLELDGAVNCVGRCVAYGECPELRDIHLLPLFP